MKMYVYNTKRQIILDQIDLGPLEEKDIKLINTVVSFLNDNEILHTTKYRHIELCDNIKVVRSGLDDFQTLIITNAKLETKHGV